MVKGNDEYKCTEPREKEDWCMRDEWESRRKMGNIIRIYVRIFFLSSSGKVKRD